MDIGKCFRDAWGLFRADLGPLIVTAVIGGAVIALVAAVAIGATAAAMLTAAGSDANGLAAGGLVVGVLVTLVVSVVAGAWMYATLYGMLLGRVRNRAAASFGEMGRYFALVGPFILATIVLGIIIGLGYAFFIIPGVIFTTWWLLTLVVMVDQRLPFGEAMSVSKELSARVGFWNMLVTWLVGALAWGAASAVVGWIPYLGNVISMLIIPFALAYTVSMYLQARGEGHIVDEALGLVTSSGHDAGRPQSLPPAPPPSPGTYASPAPAPRPAAQQAPAAGDDAWRAAADPIAAAPAGGESRASAPIGEAAARPARDAAAGEAVAPPEHVAPPAPPAPPAPEPPAPPAPPQP